jgi:hypothetical protein
MADKLAFEQNQIPLNLKPRVKLNSWISHRVTIFAIMTDDSAN